MIAVDQLPLDLEDLAVATTPPPPPANDEVVAERKADRPAGQRCATSARFPSTCRGARR